MNPKLFLVLLALLACASPMFRSIWTPQSSGPRCRTIWTIRRRRSGSAPASPKFSTPAIPHIVLLRYLPGKSRNIGKPP